MKVRFDKIKDSGFVSKSIGEVVKTITKPGYPGGVYVVKMEDGSTTQVPKKQATIVRESNMKYLKSYKLFEADSEDFNPYDDEPLTNTERMFGKQTRLEKQFSEIVVNGLINDTSEGYWSTFNALKGEIRYFIDDIKDKEFMHRIIEGEDPKEVIQDMFSDLPYDEEGTRLYTKFMRLKNYDLTREGLFTDEVTPYIRDVKRNRYDITYTKGDDSKKTYGRYGSDNKEGTYKGFDIDTYSYTSSEGDEISITKHNFQTQVDGKLKDNIEYVVHVNGEYLEGRNTSRSRIRFYDLLQRKYVRNNPHTF